MTVSSFISEVRLEYDDWLKANNEILTKIFTWAFLIDKSTVQALKEINHKKKETKLLKTMGNIPDFSQHTMKQRGIIIKWQKNMYRGDYLLSRSMRSLENVDLLKEITEIQSKNIDQNLKKFLLEAKSLHYLGFYDAAIIICGKSTEYILKDKLHKESIKFSEKWGISRLYNHFKSKYQKEKTIQKITENVEEIIRHLRNQFAHDNPRIASENDSNLVWHSLLFLLDELMEFI